MKTITIHKALRHEPFHPFSFRLADGRELAVEHPEFVAVSKRRVVVIGKEESVAILEPRLIVSLEFAGRKKSK